MKKSRTIILPILKIFRQNYEIEKGLMFSNVPKDVGFLFIMPRCEVQSFWMKNTYISLDMIFLDRNRVVVGIIKETTPLDLSSYSVDIPSCYVIEAKHGFVEKYGIEIGDHIIMNITGYECDCDYEV